MRAQLVHRQAEKVARHSAFHPRRDYGSTSAVPRQNQLGQIRRQEDELQQEIEEEMNQQALDEEDFQQEEPAEEISDEIEE